MSNAIEWMRNANDKVLFIFRMTDTVRTGCISPNYYSYSRLVVNWMYLWLIALECPFFYVYIRQRSKRARNVSQNFVIVCRIFVLSLYITFNFSSIWNDFYRLRLAKILCSLSSYFRHTIIHYVTRTYNYYEFGRNSSKPAIEVGRNSITPPMVSLKRTQFEWTKTGRSSNIGFRRLRPQFELKTGNGTQFEIAHISQIQYCDAHNKCRKCRRGV